MKCDTCKFQRVEWNDDDRGHSSVWCAKGHWDGIGPDGPLEPGDIDPWAGCEDYEEAE